MESFFSGGKTNRILSNLESTTAHMDRIAARLDGLAAGGTLDGALDEARAAVVDARALIADMKEELKAMQLAERSGKAGRLIEGMDRKTRDVITDLKATSENLRQASETLDMLLDRLHANPSDLLFSKPPKAPQTP
jgi:DNA repair ATPase RecN